MVIKIKSTRKELPKERDMENLHAILFVPVTCTLPLIDLLKLRPKLWNDLCGCLNEKGLWAKHTMLQNVHTQDVASQENKHVM